MPLEQLDTHHLDTAIGYLELEMFADADAELDLIDLQSRSVPEVLNVRVEVYRGAKKWDLMLAASKELAELDSSHVESIVNYAYETLRARSLQQAKAVLLAAIERDPKPAIYHFNLACYHCRLGEMTDARACLSEAFKRDVQFRQMAVEDPHLEPLWDWLETIRLASQ